MCRVAAETSTRKPGPLERGGTLEGEKAAGKDAGAAARRGGGFGRGGGARPNASNACGPTPAG